MSGLADIIKTIAARAFERARPALAWARARLSLLAVFVPITLIVAGLAAYGLMWRATANGVRDSIVQFQAAQRSLGREVSWDSLDVTGFPYRVEGVVNTLRYTAPDQGNAWTADKIVVHMQPLALGRISVSFEGQQRYFYARERLIDTDVHANKATVTLSPNGEGRERIDVDVKGLTGRATFDDVKLNFIVNDATGGIDVAKAHTPGGMPRIEVTARLQNVALRGALAVNLPLGPSIQLIDIDAGAKLPLHLPEPSLSALLGAWRRTGTPVDLRRFDLDWGGVTLSASGTFTLDTHSLPEGRFNVRIGNHPRVLEILEESGWINAEMRGTLKRALDALAFVSPDQQRRVSLPVRIADGNVYLGPVKVASLLPGPTASMQLSVPDVAGP